MVDKPKDSGHISDLRFDPGNERDHTQRSQYFTAESLQRFGPLRSLVGRRLPNGEIEIKAGNGTLEQAGQIGIENYRVVERQKDELVVVVADDLTDDQWEEYRVADNRASDVAGWQEDKLKETHRRVNLEGWFTEEEISDWDKEDVDYQPPEDFPEYDEGIETEHECPKCGYRWSGGGEDG